MNLPNKLTILRVVLIPFMMFFYLADFIPYGIGKLVALAIFIIASLTDMLDGQIARKRNLVTNFGKFLDPIADKMLTSALLFMLVADHTIPAPYGAIIITTIISREFMVSALRLLVASRGTVLAADKWGKIKTVVQMIAIPVCVVLSYLYTCGFNTPNALVLTFEILSYTLIGLATVLTVISGINYIVKNRHAFKEDAKQD